VPTGAKRAYASLCVPAAQGKRKFPRHNHTGVRTKAGTYRHRIGRRWPLLTASARCAGVENGAEQVQGSKFVGVGVERQFQQRQRELEQPQQQQLRSSGSFLKMMLSE